MISFHSLRAAFSTYVLSLSPSITELIQGSSNYSSLYLLKSILEGNNRIVPEDTKQVKKIHPFIYERYFDKITSVINFRIDVGKKSMLSITSS